MVPLQLSSHRYLNIPLTSGFLNASCQIAKKRNPTVSTPYHPKVHSVLPRNGWWRAAGSAKYTVVGKHLDVFPAAVFIFTQVYLLTVSVSASLPAGQCRPHKSGFLFAENGAWQAFHHKKSESTYLPQPIFPWTCRSGVAELGDVANNVSCFWKT